MYTVLLSAQVAITILLFICVMLLIKQKNSSASKLMLITCLCTLIQNAGYILELSAKSIEEAMVAIRLEYLGTAFIATSMTIFVVRYCRAKFPKVIEWILLALDCCVVLCVWGYKVVPFYYTSVEFDATGAVPHAVLGKGFLYILFAVLQCFQFILCSVICVTTAVRTRDKIARKNYILLALATTFPMIIFIFGIASGYQYFDPVPMGDAIGVLTFCSGIIFRHVFELVESAHEDILMELNDAIIILDYQKGYQEANKAALRLFPEIAVTPFGELIQNDEFNRLVDIGGARELVLNDRYYDVHVNKLYNKSSINRIMMGYTVVFFDVTDNHLQMDKMRELTEAADAANHAKSSFLANVSHEIRTPINVVVGMSDVIIRDYEDSKLLGYAQNIQGAAKNLLELINDILDFSKIETGRVSLNQDDYRVDEFFNDIITVFDHKGDEKGLSFEKKISPSIPQMLYGDEVRIRQIVTNLLSNAFKYTQKGGVSFRAAFDWAGSEKGNLMITVEDTGIGIRHEDIDKLFEVFVRIDERAHRSIEGTGLGLNITKQLIDIMGGEIKVSSEYGKGSIFTVIIPQVIKSKRDETIGELKQEVKKVERAGVGYTAPNAKVLIVDDSKTNLIVAKALLRDTKVKVTTCLSGEECLEKVTAEHFDVIFLDHRMPGMDGVTTLHKMMAMEHQCKTSPVIMLTANAVTDAKAYYLAEGFTDFVTKPISEKTITTILHNYLPAELIVEEAGE